MSTHSDFLFHVNTLASVDGVRSAILSLHNHPICIGQQEVNPHVHSRDLELVASAPDGSYSLFMPRSSATRMEHLLGIPTESPVVFSMTCAAPIPNCRYFVAVLHGNFASDIVECRLNRPTALCLPNYVISVAADLVCFQVDTQRGTCSEILRCHVQLIPKKTREQLELDLNACLCVMETHGDLERLRSAGLGPEHFLFTLQRLNGRDNGETIFRQLTKRDRYTLEASDNDDETVVGSSDESDSDDSDMVAPPAKRLRRE